MLKHRRRKLVFILLLIAGVAAAEALVLSALRQNINLYLTPSQVKQRHLSQTHEFRIGGMVVVGSIHRVPTSLRVSFLLTDYHQRILVDYDGVLPSLFREGQGIVATGHLNQQNVFIADQVLAKHDSRYRPPEIGKLPSQGSLLSNNVHRKQSVS